MESRIYAYIILYFLVALSTMHKEKKIQKCAMNNNPKKGLFLVLKICRKRFLYMDFIAKTIILI